MGKPKTFLCVGGPKAGQMMTALYGSTCRVFIGYAPNPGNSIDAIKLIHSEGQNKTITSAQFITYKEEVFHFPEGEKISFWVPENQTPRQTMQLLIHAYVNAPRWSA